MSNKKMRTKGPGKQPAAVVGDAEGFSQRILQNFAAGNYRGLASEAEAAVAAFPGKGFFWKALGVARNLTGERGERVITPLAEAARLQPGDAEVFDGLGLALARAGRLDEAVVAAARAVALAPGHAIMQTNYGNLLVDQHRYGEAIAAHRRAVQLDPNLAVAWSNLGSALRGMPWLHGEAQAAFYRALGIAPNLQAAWDNLLFMRQYQSEPVPRDILREALSAAEALTLALPSPPRKRPPARPLAGRRLRVGWVSADLREHTVGNALLAVMPHLAGHDVEVFAYSNNKKCDAATQQIKALAAAWREVSDLSDEALTALVADDGIDVLVDLSGRTRGHRLGVFARRAAPVQVCWLGWFSTSGLPQMDWYLADRLTLPVAEHRFFAERCWPIAGPYYVQRRDDLKVLPEDDGYQGPIRFACFNNLGKLSTRTLDLWARVLVALPGATLTLKSSELASPEVGAGLRHEFVRRGVNGAQLQLEGLSPLADYLRAFNRIDLCLDPTPFTGGATSYDSLLMGVPVLTLTGDRLLTHQGENLLRRLGLDEWVAADDAAYVAKAIAAAGSVAALRAGRAALRERFLASPLVDGAALAAQLATAWHGMHENALAGPPVPVLPEDPVALQKVASILLHLEEWSPAQEAWGRLAALAPDATTRADARARQAIALQGAERYGDALVAYREVLPVLGKLAAYTLHLNMGACCQQLQRYDEAVRHADAALLAQPGDPVARRNAAASCLESGDVERAIVLYSGLQSVLPEVETAYLYALNFRMPYDPLALLAAHRAWGLRMEQGAIALFAGLPSVQPAAAAVPRRIGFLSHDFRRHPVASFALPMLRELRGMGCELYFYSDVRKADEVTAVFRALSERWVDCQHDDDRTLASRIRSDGIDVLVDLAGLSGPRPAFLAARHAPLQLSWLGYGATSGLATVDALLTDSALDVPGEADRHYVEPLLRLDPSFVSFAPPEPAPEVAPLPAADGRPLTFVSFNKPYKLNRPTLQVWGAVLRAVPDSRLLVVGKGLAGEDTAARRRLAGWLAEEGIAERRVEWQDQLPFAAYLAAHARADIALDCLPWSGHTVTVNAAWMGVPTLAVGGRHHAGRFSVATMCLLGRDDFAIETTGEVDAELLERVAATARRLADPAARVHLAGVRAGLRERLLSSPLSDHAGLAERFVAAIEQLWAQRTPERP